MKITEIEKLNQLISRTDMTGNEKVEWLKTFIDEREKQLLIHGVIPRSFYVVAKTYETGEDLAQLSIALDSYEKAKTFRDSKFNKKRYPNAFIVSSLNEV